MVEICTIIITALAALLGGLSGYFLTPSPDKSWDAVTELNKSFDVVLSEYMIPADEVSVYKKYYDMVQEAFQDIDTNYRNFYTSKRIQTVPTHSIDKVAAALIEELFEDLGRDDNSEMVAKKIERIPKWVKYGVDDMNKITRINLVYEFGGKSDIIVGAVGFRAKGPGKVEIGISVYKEVWELAKDDKMLQRMKEWQEHTITKYGFYALLLPE